MQLQNKSKVISRLRRALDRIPELKKNRSGFEKWKRDTKIAIEHAFEAKSDHVNDFINIRYSPRVYVSGDDRAFQNAYEHGLNSASAVLESMIDEVEEYCQDDGASTSASPTGEPNTGREIFLIHGRDEGTRDAVARFLQQLKLEPVILAEQASQGRTIIEKFEGHVQVKYAIALLTPDDAGSLRDEADDLRLRARQNVIFELGFFIGRLGRERVCALTKGDVEIPSDYSGVEYFSLEEGDRWKLQLVRELKAAGFDVDANLVV